MSNKANSARYPDPAEQSAPKAIETKFALYVDH